MSSAMRKPPPPNNTPGRRGPASPSVSPSVGPRSPTPGSNAPTNGMARTRSVRGSTTGTPVSARAAAKRPAGSLSGLGSNNVSSASEDADEDDAKAETAALIEDLKIRLEKSDTVAEEYQRQLEVVQSRLDDALNEQARLEESVHESSEKIEVLENDKREAQRQARELENIYEAERVAIMQEKEEMVGREEELHLIIQRLKDSLSQRDMRPEWAEGGVSRSSNNSSPAPSKTEISGIDREHFAPPSVPQRSDSKNNSKLLLQKDKLIESLRLELAEAQIKLVESDNLGGTRLQDLERQLLETRVANARLMEDNESFQLLLGEKTLNGDISKADFMQMHHSHGSRPTSSNGHTSDRNSTGLGSSLADELESAAEGESENYRRLEAEARSLKDQNKALTLYINNIIERLLSHKDFEAILDKTPNLLSGSNPASARHAINTEKELPPPPPPKPDAGSSILQRAKSVAIGAGRARPRPMSFMPSSTTNTSMTEDPSTAPSIPLARSQSLRGGSGGAHRRSNSEWPNPASVVNQMYRGPSPSGSGTTSPGVQTPRAQTSFFSPPPREGNPNAAARVPSTSSQHHPSGSSSNSTASDYSGEVPSPPHSHASVSSGSTAGGKIEGNKLRPLRLVQENSSEMGNVSQKPPGIVRKGSDSWEPAGDEAASRRAKRNSWMGWFSRGKDEENLSSITAEPVKEERDF
ncbi:hypothetical protein GP486_006735 [Trichoglossum hirsutum]|uniref:M protein, serotype 2.1 n=1 Tax=Trichoglossum hirsutum TaxID=265104 RepID=A0A9P8IDZ7_9PEZI|nr:hypothetical protein GP486_006735 [Trichoglossum hirsutum]